MTNHVPNHVVTNPNINAPNQPVVNTSANPGASSHPIHHEWVWLRLEGSIWPQFRSSPSGMPVNSSHHTQRAVSNAHADSAVEPS